jgi:glycosyltransferase involved in cell wall biosynthesis
MVDVTVVTASRGDRPGQLARAMLSVTAQTVPCAHLVGVDPSRSVAAVRNTLIEAAGTEWIAFLDDDDVLDPNHLEVLLAHADDADVIIPHCRFLGEPLPRLTCCDGYYNRPYVEKDLRQHGIWPITVLARRAAIIASGLFREDDEWEDWRLFNRMADQAARFVVVPQPTWTYDRRDAARGRTAAINAAS